MNRNAANGRRRVAAVSCCFALLFAAACASRPPRGAAPGLRPHGSVAGKLERIFSDDAFAAAQWGVQVVSLDRGDSLYERNASKLYVPASNNKILTAAIALLRLGASHRFETRVMADGSIAAGALQGSLVIVGGGDPTLDGRFHDGDALAPLRAWARRLKASGVARIEGDVVGDERAFEEPEVGQGWGWDQLGYGYSARVSALAFNDNVLQLEITPRGVRMKPLPDYLVLDARISEAAAGEEASIDVLPGVRAGELRLHAAIPPGAPPLTRTVAVDGPAAYFAEAMRRVLMEEGIAVSGRARSARGSGYARRAEDLTLLWSHASPPLGDVVKPLLKLSQNFYAEMLARAIGGGSFAAARLAVEETLFEIGIAKGSFAYADGSGLSRYNLVSAEQLVRVLRHMHRHPSFAAFHDALPIAGVDGTLERRMRGTPAEGNVRAKTGSLSRVRALSGYVRTAGGELLAFSMLANNYMVPQGEIDKAQDAALAALAALPRR